MTNDVVRRVGIDSLLLVLAATVLVGAGRRLITTLEKVGITPIPIP